MQVQPLHRRKIISVARVFRHWEMDPVNGPANQAGYAISEIDDPVEVRRQRKVIELEIAETEMQPKPHTIGYNFGDLFQQAAFIGPLDRDLENIIDILPDHANRGRDTDLKPASG